MRKLEDNLTSRLARYVVSMEYEDIPANVIHMAKMVFMDIVGCGLGSHELDKGRIGKEVAVMEGGTPEATVLGSGEKLNLIGATFANAELMHAMDYDVITPPMHVAPFVCPIVLTVGEKYGITGKELLTALIAGFEVGSRLGLALPNIRDKSKPVRSNGCGVMAFGAACAAGKIVGLDEVKMTDAMGLAGYFAPVPAHTKYMNTPNNGAMKFGPAGFTAEAGLLAVLLAQKGELGDRSVLEGDYGFWAMNGSPTFDADTVVRGLGKDFKIMQSKFKSLPCDGIYQTSLGLLYDLCEEEDLKPEEIEYVMIKAEANMFCPQFMSYDIETNVDASMSFPFCAAVAAFRIPIGPDWQKRGVYGDPVILDFMRNKTRFEVLPYAEECRRQEIEVEHKAYINRRPAVVEVSARGKVFERKGEYAKWLSSETPEFTATDADLVDKFYRNVKDCMSDEKAKKAVDMLMDLENLESVKGLIQALTF